MAEVEEEGERVIVEDEADTNIDLDSEEDDDDWDGDDDDEAIDSMYDSPLDKIDEVIHFHTQLSNLQQAGGQDFHAFLMQQLDPQET